MPIVPCFDPDTGASGGPSSGGGPAPGPGAHEWVPELTLDLETATPVAQVTASGSNQTVSHVMGAVTLDANFKAWSSNNATYEVTANGGELAGQNAASSTSTLAYKLTPLLASLGYEWLCKYPVAVQVLVKNWQQAHADDGIYFGINNNTYTHNSGKFRGIYTYQDSVDPAVEKRFIRNTGSNTATTDGVSNTNGQGRLLTLILHGGDFVEVQEVNNVSAFAAPSTDFRDVTTYMQCGSWGLARDTTLTVYTADLSVIVSCVRQTSFNVSAIRLLRWKAP